MAEKVKNKFLKILKSKKVAIFIIFFCIIFIFLAGNSYAQATDFLGNPIINSFDKTTSESSTVKAIIGLLGWIVYFFAYVIGLILTFVIDVLVKVASFNNITNVPAVTIGWGLVRDLCNMFFILILLVIAFATILKLENYSIKRLLPKLLIMAVLINFSRTICGIIIDFGQVIMITFVNGFGQYGANNLVNTFQIKQFLAFTDKSAEADVIGAWETAGAIMAGFFAMLITFIVVLVMLAVLVMRVVMLWVYVILSPIAFLVEAFPAAKKFFSFWDDFIKQVVVGPLLAFFIWLALTTAHASSNALSSDAIGAGGEICAGQNSLFCSGSFFTYIITIALLVGGLIVTQKMGGMAGKAAGAGMGAINKGVGIGKSVGKAGFFKAGRNLDTLQMAGQRKLGVEKQSSLNYRMIAQGWKAKKAEDMGNYESAGGAHGSSVWQDTFGKFMRKEQYLGREKSDERKEDDETKAKQHDYLAKRSEERKINTGLKDLDKDKKRKEIRNSWSDVVKDYREKGGLSKEEARKEVRKDFEYTGSKDKYLEKIDKETEQHQKTSADLRVGHVGLFGGQGKNWQRRYKPIHSESGSKDLINKEISAIKERSDNDYAVISELIEGYEEKNNNRIVAALSVLAQNNDLNEALKDNRIKTLMTQDGGLIESALKDTKVTGADGKEKVMSKEEIQSVTKDYRSNNVSPAYAQALIQGMFKQTGLDDKMSARHANQIGGISFAGGNGVGYGMAMGDAATGGYKYDTYRMMDGGLESSKGRNEAIVGKFNNLESQARMRTLHPDTIIIEAPNGDANGIHEAGKAYLRSLTSHDMGQVNRVRLDVIQKIGTSDKTLKEIMDLADEVGVNNKEQAEIIRTFAGYIKGSVQGKGMKPDIINTANAGRIAMKDKTVKIDTEKTDTNKNN
ncbi:hypothetical protein DRH27_03640 [Candidatus Falkowbacteria bacterium]|nr:MAG: hypothetical protein DRH27_03640 [Candidatus Falkowbacteria bacterium]